MAARKNDEVEPADEPAGDDGSFRMSVTIDQSQRRNIRIAAAFADMSVGEWAAAVLTKMADKALENVG